MGYISESFRKLKQDLLAKGLYDLIRVAFVGLCGALLTWLLLIWPTANRALTAEWCTTPIQLALAAVVLMVLVWWTTRYLFRRKIQGIKEEHQTDRLTGLKNDKGVEAYLPGRLRELHSKKEDMSVILIDVDDFKKFNHDYGPPTADKVLGMVGQLLNEDKRATDRTFRLYQKGDEFLVVANETNLLDAITAAERKRKLIEGRGFEVDGHVHHVTVSCGVTGYHWLTDTKDALVERANRAKDVAKAVDGKNCTRSIS